MTLTVGAQHATLISTWNSKLKYANLSTQIVMSPLSQMV